MNVDQHAEKEPRCPATGPVVLVADQSFGQLWWTDDDVPGVDVLPSVAAVLDGLTARKVSVWVLADLDELGCELLGRWLPTVAGVRTTRHPLPAVLESLEGGPGVLVAADRRVRADAAGLGWSAVPSPELARWVLDGHQPCLARIGAGGDALSRLAHLVVLHGDPEDLLVYTTPESLAVIAKAGGRVHRHPIDLARQDPVLVRPAGADPHVADALGRRAVLATWGPRSSPEVLVAVDAGDELADPALHAAHGHFQVLAPLPTRPAGRRVPQRPEAALLRWRWPWPDPVRDLPVAPDWPPVRWPRCWGWSSTFADDVDRYSGAAPLDDAGPIASRHVFHPDNDRAVDALVADLRAIGYCPWVHTFSYGGRTRRNVLADLPAAGWFVRPTSLERLRARLVDPRVLEAPDRLLDGLDDVLGDIVHDDVVVDTGRRLRPDRLDPAALREELRGAAALHPWLPWWRLRCLLSGLGAGLVVVGCHLDSTASRDAGYDPATSGAPGADDDASGIAGTLAVARWLWPLRGTLRHTVRFAFFNAEEVGLVGSGAYAAHLAGFDAPVEAVVCMDMIGHEGDGNRLFEVHCGSTDAGVRDASDPIATRIASWTGALGSLPVPQIYRGTSPGGGTDRDVVDGAIGRSDHASFHRNGYPAALVSEDFFANLAPEPGSDPNPAYHRQADSTVDADYGAAIACAVAHAVKDIAGHGL